MWAHIYLSLSLIAGIIGAVSIYLENKERDRLNLTPTGDPPFLGFMIAAIVWPLLIFICPYQYINYLLHPTQDEKDKMDDNIRNK